MKNLIHKIHYAQKLSTSQEVLKFFLKIASFFYIIAINCRKTLYKFGILKKVKLDQIVISVGNLTTGGTGKTPITAEIARSLVKEGKKVAILSRGYGGSLPSNKINLINDGEKMYHNAQEAGDEPFWLAKNLKKVAVITCKNRVKAAKWAAKNLGIEVFILDDGYQHIKLERDLNIMVVDGHKKFGNEELLPAGPLREPLSEIKRADRIIVVNKKSYEKNTVKDCKAYSRYLIKTYDKKVFGCNMINSGIYNVKAGNPLACNRKLYAFTGIGQPEFFFGFLNNFPAKILKKVEYADHHNYTQNDVFDIINDAKKIGANAVITTEKDIVKLKPYLAKLGNDMPFYILRLAIEMDVANLLKGITN